MRIANNWIDYKIFDTSHGEKLETWKDYMLIRPDPQIIWNTKRDEELWAKAHARYIRSNKGGGEWNINKSLPESWIISYNDLKFNIKPTAFKHTGVFPEQAVNWDMFMSVCSKATRPLKALNLFAYTGGATLALANANVCVTHVDASKGMVALARENAAISGLSDKPIRWIVDDCEKFVNREIKRNNLYDIIVMDPPSYGRGPNGEVFKLEDNIFDLVDLCSRVLSRSPVMFVLNSYTTGLSPSVMQYLLGVILSKKFQGHISADEIGLPVGNQGLVLPCGSTAIFINENNL